MKPKGPEIIDQIADRVHAWRRLAGMNQHQFAAALGLDDYLQISRLERGVLKQIPLHLLAALVKYAHSQGLSADSLFGFEDRGLSGFPTELIKQELAQRFIADQIEGAMASARQFMAVRTVAPGPRIIDVESRPEKWVGRYVPLLGRLAAGERMDADTTYAENTPPGWADSYVEYQGAPAGAVAVRIVGDSMEPEWREGDIAIVDPSRYVKHGLARVVYSHGGQRLARLKKVRQTDISIVLESVNQKYLPVELDPRKVDLLCKVIERLPAVRETTIKT